MSYIQFLTSFLLMQVIFSKVELEISPFLTVIQFYSNMGKKRVGKSPQKISVRTHSEICLLILKEPDKTKMELPLDIVSISASICQTIGITELQHRHIFLYLFLKLCLYYLYFIDFFPQKFYYSHFGSLYH